MPLKIAIWHNLPSGGGKRALYDHVRGLLDRGHQLESWCPPTADQNYLPLGKLITEHIVDFSWAPPYARGRPGQIMNSWKAPFDKIHAMDEHCRRCSKEINRGEFDLLYANACKFFRTTSIGRFVELPKVIYLPEPYRPLYEAYPNGNYPSIPDQPWIAPSLPKSGRWSFRYLKDLFLDQIKVRAMRIQVREELRNAQAYHKILVNSFFSRESILRAYGLDSSVCYLGIDIKHFVNRHKPKENRVLGFGSIIPAKNVALVIKSIARIENLRPSLTWIGNVANRHYLNKMRQLADDLGVNLETKIGISDEEILQVLDSTLALIYAPRLEPFGLAPLEANACGVPVIAVAEGGVRETIIDGLNGLLVDPTPDAIAHAINRLISDRNYAYQLGQNGAKLVTERWPLDAAIDRLESRFTEVLNTARSPQ